MSKGNLTNNQYLNFDKCTFDLTNKPSKAVTLFSMKEDNSDGKTTQNAHINITNSSVVGSVSNVVMVNKNDTDSFKASFTDGTEYTEYGLISSEYSNVDSHPFVLFTSGKVVKTFTSYYSFLTYIKTNTLTADSTLLLRKDWNTSNDTKASNNDRNLAYLANGGYALTIDLGGKTITRGGNHLFQLFGVLKGDKSVIDLTIKNGFVHTATNNTAPIVFNNAGDSTVTEIFNVTFDDVTFTSLASNGGQLVTAYTGGDASKRNISFNNCKIDFTNYTGTAFNLNEGGSVNKVDVNISFNNTVITMATPTKPVFVTLSTARDDASAPDSISFGQNVKLVLPTAQHPDLSVKTKNGKFAVPLNRVSKDGKFEYTFVEVDGANTKVNDVLTIPAQYSNAERYPFVLYNSNGFVKAYTTWYHFLQSASNAADYKANESPILLMRRDYSTTECNASSQALYAFDGEFVLDLGGHSFSRGANHMFQAYNKSTGTTGTSTKVTVKNGNLLMEKAMAFIVYNNASNVTARARFDFDFESTVTFGIKKASTTTYFIVQSFGNTDGGASVDGKVTLNGCTIDLTENKELGTIAPPKDTFTIFDAYDTQANTTNKIDIVVNGGRIIANDMSKVTIVKTEDGEDSFAFGKYNGAYTTLELPAGSTAPTTDFGGYKFAEKSTNGTTTTYILVPTASIGLDFTPKASVTLDSTLIFNIYLPAHAGLGAVTLNGETVTLGEAVDGYYVISTPLTASESAEELKLVVNLTVNGTALKGSFTFSTVKYAEKLLATAGISDAEQTLAKDMLAYINSAYVFFKGESVAKIDAILDGYTSTTTIDKANAKKTVPGLSGATFTLEAKPTVQFFFADGFKYADFTFKVGGRTLTAEDVEEQNDEYVKFALFAYEMTETFTYTVGGDSGEYNLIAYYAYASGTGENDYKGDDKAELTDLAAKFYNYCASAKAYRASVIGK